MKLQNSLHNQNISSLNNGNIFQQQRLNKDSVNTNIEEEVNEVITNSGDIKKVTQNQEKQTIKTKPILKWKQKQPGHIMKHTKILQTLRNITKNIKSQINNTQRPLMKEEKVHMNQEVKMVNQQPEIKYVQKQNGDAKMIEGQIEKNEKIVKETEIQKQESLQSQKQKVIQQHAITETINNFTTQSSHLHQHSQPPPQQQSHQSPQKITLYSKYTNTLQSYPVYQQKLLTQNKQLRQITIKRQLDNDIQSEDEQIQLGVGYLYYQLVSSCKKNDTLIKMASLMKSRSKVKAKCNNNDSKMEHVKQRLVFN